MQIAEEAVSHLLEKENVSNHYSTKHMPENTLLTLLLISGPYRETATLQHHHVQTRIFNSMRGKRCCPSMKQNYVAFDLFILSQWDLPYSCDHVSEPLQTLISLCKIGISTLFSVFKNRASQGNAKIMKYLDAFKS